MFTATGYTQYGYLFPDGVEVWCDTESKARRMGAVRGHALIARDISPTRIVPRADTQHP